MGGLPRIPYSSVLFAFSLAIHPSPAEWMALGAVKNYAQNCLQALAE